MSKQKTALDLINGPAEETAEVATSETREAGCAAPKEIRSEETIDTIKEQFAFLKTLATLTSFIAGKDLQATVKAISPKLPNLLVEFDIYKLFRDGYSRIERRDEFVQIGTYWESLSPLNVWGSKQHNVTVADFGVFKRLSIKRQTF